jgi:NTE family protein
MSFNYSNLVFEGGGVKGIAYVGALQVLQQKNILQQVKAVAGTSAGSIVAALLSLGYDATGISTIMNELDFSKLEDGWDPLRIPFTYGLYKGDYFLNWMRQRIKEAPGKNLSETATFADCKNAGCKDLHVFATDLNIKNVKEFCIASTPTVPVAEAVRASMSIPLFFKAWQFSNSNPDNHIYVDGGVVLNYPITVFDTGDEPNMQTLGFFLENMYGVSTSIDLKYDLIIGYIKSLFDTILDSQVIDFEEDSAEKLRSVMIDDHGISATDFHLTEAQKQLLIQSGIDAANKFLGQ